MKRYERELRTGGVADEVALLARLLDGLQRPEMLALSESRARGYLEAAGGLDRLLSDPRVVTGLTEREVSLLAATAEIARRYQPGLKLSEPITGPADVLAHVADIRNSNREDVVALYLDSRNRVIHRELVARGGLRASTFQPRDVLGPALNTPTAAMILAHNHPSGDPQPSVEDHEVTRKLSAAAALIGVELLDHLVVTRRGYTSLREAGAL